VSQSGQENPSLFALVDDGKKFRENGLNWGKENGKKKQAKLRINKKEEIKRITKTSKTEDAQQRKQG